MNETRIVIVLWEPRWHGFARWTLIEQHDLTMSGRAETELARGWWRPPPGWRWQEIVVRDYDGAPLQWLPFMRGHILGRVDAELQADAP